MLIKKGPKLTKKANGYVKLFSFNLIVFTGSKKFAIIKNLKKCFWNNYIVPNKAEFI